MKLKSRAVALLVVPVTCMLQAGGLASQRSPYTFDKMTCHDNSSLQQIENYIVRFCATPEMVRVFHKSDDGESFVLGESARVWMSVIRRPIGSSQFAVDIGEHCVVGDYCLFISDPDQSVGLIVAAPLEFQKKIVDLAASIEFNSDALHSIFRVECGGDHKAGRLFYKRFGREIEVREGDFVTKHGGRIIGFDSTTVVISERFPDEAGNEVDVSTHQPVERKGADCE
ncbi:MAG: hypothetical protein IPG63_01660 [Xanthomonadales bacterium]|nr:hypothetical protein [Xanthomonadales bacterium]